MEDWKQIGVIGLTNVAKFITCNFCTGHLFMANLAAVHSFGICAFPILDSVQLNIHCLFFLFRVLQVLRKKTQKTVP